MNRTALATVLIVDDEVANMRALCDTLREQGYQTQGCGSGEEALAILRKTSFDVLLTDLMMPGMDGVQLLGAVRGVDPHIAGILMTGQGTIATAVKAMQAGAMDYVLKPLKLSAILPVLARAVNMRRVNLENMELRNTVAIHEFSQAIAHTLDMRLLLDKIADAILAQFEADEGSVMLLEDNGQALYVAAVRGTGRSALLGMRVPLGTGLAGLAAVRGEPVVQQGDQIDSQLSLADGEARSALSMPMFARSRLLGVLNISYVQRARPIPFGQIKLMSIFINAAAASIEAARLYEDMGRARASYREVLDMAADGIISTDSEQRIRVFSQGAEEIFGYRADDILGKPLDLLWTDGAAEAYRRHLLDLNRNGDARLAAVERTRLAARRKDGAPITVEVGVSRRAEKEQQQYTVVVRDVTRQLQAEEKQRRQDELTQLQGALAEVLNEAPTLTRALQLWLDRLCQHSQWRIGHCRTFLRRQFHARQVAASQWSVDDPVRFERFTSFGGEGAAEVLYERYVPQLLHARTPVWIEDFAALEPPAPRWTLARQCGLVSGMAFPVVVGREVVAVLEFFAGEARPPDTLLLASLPAIAGHLSQAIERYQASEVSAELAAIVENTTEAIIGRSFDNTVVAWNKGAERMFGYSAAETLGTRESSIAPAESRADALAKRALVQRGEAIPPYEAVRLTKAGVRINVRIALSPVRDAAGNLMGTSAVIHDITESKKAEAALRASEERFRLLTAGVKDYAIVMLDAQGRVMTWNEGAQRLKGYTEAEIVGEPISRFYPPEDAAAGLPARVLARVEAEGHSVGTGWRVRKDGSRFFADVLMTALRDEAGVLIGFAKITRDITEKRAAEEALQRFNNELEDMVEQRTVELRGAREEADAANRAKSTFLATMSHEIRTPMNGVIGMIDVLHQTSLRGDQLEMVDLIRESAYSLLAIINDILDFSKIEAGKLELEASPIMLPDIVEGVAGLMNGMAGKQEVMLTVHVDPAIPARVSGDLVRVRQVLTNLLNNAIKFSSGQRRRGRVSLQARLAEVSAGNAEIEFTVADNGIGMDEATQRRLFSAFTQADLSTTRRFGGTGLGLAIVHNLVRMTGGHITVRSVPNEGSAFIVRMSFPILTEPHAAAPPSEIAGLPCRVVGHGEPLADVLCDYLRHAQAVVEAVPDLAAAVRYRTGGASVSEKGPVAWVVCEGDEPLTPEQLRAAAADAMGGAAGDTRIVWVRLLQGKRFQPQLLEPGLVMVDGNALSTRTLTRAVAVAIGRASFQYESATAGSMRQLAAPTREEARRQHRLILVAEDNQTNQKVIQRQLTLLGYAADIVADGPQALAAWQRGDYALLLTDLHMPMIDGYELTRRIRAAEPAHIHIPIVALTANALKGEADKCLAAGMDDYRSKPIPLAELKAVLDKWLPLLPAVEAGAAMPDAAAGAEASPAPLPPPAHAVPLQVSVLKNLIGDDPALVVEFLRDFRLSATAIGNELRAACAHSQLEQVAAAAHKLKSSAGSVGAVALGELCAALESEARDREMQAVKVLQARFDSELAAVVDFIDRYLSKV